MAVWKCDKCSETKESRCKPKNPCACGGAFVKVEEEKKSSGCGCGKKKCS
jgi:ABC-type ATPase with predicted acetyltransferase domain